MEIFKPSIRKILPSSISNDRKVLAAAEALDLELKKLSAEIKNVLHLPRLEELSGEVLDHLAAQYHCDFYSTEFSDAVKRNQIRETIFWHRIKGTPRGVEKAVSTFMVNAKVEENWEYGGEPYFFRIVTKGLKYLTDESEFLRLVYDSKNVRSWLEEIIFDLTIEEPQTLWFASDEVDTGKVTFEPAQDILSAENIFYQYAFELTAGRVVFEPAHEENLQSNFLVAAADFMRGNIFFEPDNLNYFYVPLKKNFKDDPLIKFYLHHSDEEIIIPDDEYDFEPDTSFLRLYFKFPDNTIRYFNILNPKDDLSAAEINAVGNFAVEKNLLWNGKNFSTIALKAAKLFQKKFEEVAI